MRSLHRVFITSALCLAAATAGATANANVMPRCELRAAILVQDFDPAATELPVNQCVPESEGASTIQVCTLSTAKEGGTEYVVVLKPDCETQIGTVKRISQLNVAESAE